MTARFVHYFDYKSPYAFLAQEASFALQEELGVELEWLPYALAIPSYAGAAELDESGRDIVGERNPHQWRRVRYAYVDCRREAARSGLVLRGPRMIFDSSVAHIGFLYARARGRVRPYHDRVFESFFRRELDVGDPRAIEKLLAESGVDASGFEAYLAGPGRAEQQRIQREAEELGVFGVPSYLVDGELFWGAERIDRARELILEKRAG